MTDFLSVDLALKEGDPNIIIPVLVTIVFFMIYWFTSQSGRVRNWFYSSFDHDTAAVRHFLSVKILGFAVLGLIPLILTLILLPGYSPADLGLTFRVENPSFTLAVAAVLVVLAVFSAGTAARKAKDREHFPQIRAKVWTTKTVMANIAGWGVYLLGYEILFRGILLIPLTESIGVWPAITVNIALYAAAHVPQGSRDAFGAIPVGLIFCLVTLATGTVYIAFLVHLSMALTNCFTSMKHHPDMSFLKK
jgi:membrane protease YdiL (CAAX protease family)